MNESLKELATRRLAEIGKRRGGEPISLLSAWETLPEDAGGKRAISYETARRVAEGDHTNIGGKTADALALMFGVHSDDVLVAAGKRPRLGPFILPERASRLDRKERRVVLSVVEAILDAAEGKAVEDDGNSEEQKIDEVEARRQAREQQGTKKRAARKTTDRRRNDPKK